MLNAEDIMTLLKPQSDKIVAEHRLAEQAKFLELIIGQLGAAVIQRAPSDDKIIADHIEQAHELAKTAYRRLTA